jgi:hypothetical protein
VQFDRLDALMPRPAEHLPLQLGTFFLPTLYVAWFRVKEPQPMGVRESDSLIMGGLLVATVLTSFCPRFTSHGLG